MKRVWPWLLLLALWALVYWRSGLGMDQARWYVLALLLVVITETDMRAKLIPDRVTYPGTVLGLGLNALGGMEALGMAAAGAAVGFVVLEGFRRLMGRLATMEVMGMGDSKLLMMCGAFLGPTLVMWSLLPGVVIGLVFGTIYTKLAKSPHFPFGPSLGLGALVTALFPKAVSEGVMAFPEKMQTMGTGARMTILLGSIIALVLLMRRIRRRAAEYTEAIEKDYENNADS